MSPFLLGVPVLLGLPDRFVSISYEKSVLQLLPANQRAAKMIRDVELVDVTPEGQVQVRFKGACVRCPSSGMTLHGGIEKNLRAIVPEVESVISVQ